MSNKQLVTSNYSCGICSVNFQRRTRFLTPSLTPVLLSFFFAPRHLSIATSLYLLHYNFCLSEGPWCVSNGGKRLGRVWRVSRTENFRQPTEHRGGRGLPPKCTGNASPTANMRSASTPCTRRGTSAWRRRYAQWVCRRWDG